MIQSKNFCAGLVAGVALTAVGAIMMGQGASQPVKSATEYYVTTDGVGAHLWVREGAALSVVGHGICKECSKKGHAHDAKSETDGKKDDDHGHDHAPAKK